ncbi:MAG: biotin--[acetyl-CoA-carboxylase] ligase [Pseudomonadota bacterium]
MIGKFLSGLADGFRHQALEVCASTNTECLNAADVGDSGNLWITSKRQTGGKGSRGRSWTSEPGNLFTSLLLVDPCQPGHLAELTFVAAVAVGDTLNELLPDLPRKHVGLKWPNDVLVRGRKISGILLEGGTRNTMTHVAIGIGINCKSNPKDTIYPATCLSTEGSGIVPQDVFDTLAPNMAQILNLWDRGRNFEAVRSRWLQNAVGIGQEVEVRLEGREPEVGTFDSIDENGHMVMKTRDGRLNNIAVGDVFFRGSPELGE